MTGMSNTATQPRRKDRNEPGNGGRFTTHEHTAPDPDLSLSAQPAIIPLLEVNRARRGHVFLPKAANKWPKLYSTEDTPLADKTVVAHYFVGGSDWWIVEYDPRDHTAFGYADLGLGFGEWGYIDMAELERTTAGPAGWLVVERDLYWEPGKVSDSIPAYKS